MPAMVTMTHPGIAGTATATAEAFETVWEGEGWVLAGVDPVPYLPSAMRWTGPWSSLDLYDVGDAVQRSGATYVAKLANRNHDPATDSPATYWDLVAGGTGGGGGDVNGGSA